MALSRSTGGREGAGPLFQTSLAHIGEKCRTSLPCPPVLPLTMVDDAAAITVLPPLKSWTRPCVCHSLADLTEQHGPLMCMRIKPGAPRWSQLDDAAREVVGAEHHRPHDERGLWIWYQGAWTLTAKSYLPGIVDRLTTLKGLRHLVVRDAPNAQTCDHDRCKQRRRRASGVWPPTPRRSRPRRHASVVTHIGPQALYRFYDQHGQLLYIGITMDLGSRWYSHDRGKPWWIDVARATVEHFPTRSEALDAEAAAIQRERPLWNVVHNT